MVSKTEKGLYNSQREREREREREIEKDGQVGILMKTQVGTGEQSNRNVVRR